MGLKSAIVLLLQYIAIYLLGGVTFVPLLVWFFWYKSPKIPSSAKERTLNDQLKEEKLSQEKGNPPGYRSLKAGDVLDAENVGLKTYHAGWVTVTKEFYKLTQINPDDFRSNANFGEMTNSSEPDGSTDINNGDKNSIGAGLFNKLRKSAGNSSSASQSLTEQASLDEKYDSKDADLQNVHEIDVGAAKMKQIRRRNRYYGVIKHGNLFLYSDETQKDVKHAIVLEHYFVAVWPRNLTDAQIFTKRSAICLIQKDQFSKSPKNTEELIDLLNHDSDTTQLPRNSYFLYGDTSYEKEDWYMALLRASYSDKKAANNPLLDALNPKVMAKPLHYYTSDMLELIDTLNSTENQLTTKWLNAITGRLFLSLYQTPEFKQTFRNKIEERLKKIRTPGFLDQLQIQRIDVGHAAPFITNPKLKSLNPDGEMEVTLDFLYKGKAMVEIATKLFINIGVGFKQRQFDIVMKVILNKMQGELLIKLKPQPSSRVWYTFTKMPEIEMNIEPVFSSRNISYGIITNLLQNRFKEAIKQSIVYPFFDDFVFYNSAQELFRGGIFDRSVRADIESLKRTVLNSNLKADLTFPLNSSSSQDEVVSEKHVDSKSATPSLKSKTSVSAIDDVDSLAQPIKIKLDTVKDESEVQTPKNSISETDISTPDLKDTVIKSYSKIKYWYKKTPQNATSAATTSSDNVATESTTPEVKRNGSNKISSSNSKKESNYIPPEMISNRRRKSSRAESIPHPDNFSQNESTADTSSFKLLSSGMTTRPSAEAFANFERKRGASRSSRISSISSIDETSSTNTPAPIPGSPSSPEMFISEKFRNKPSNAHSTKLDFGPSINNNLITSPVLNFDPNRSPTKKRVPDNSLEFGSKLPETLNAVDEEVSHSPLPPLPSKDRDIFSSNFENNNWIDQSLNVPFKEGEKKHKVSENISQKRKPPPSTVPISMPEQNIIDL